MTSAGNRSGKRGLVLYLGLAMGITWLCWIPAILISGQHGYLLPSVNNMATLWREGYVDGRHLWVAILFSWAVYGPLIAGICATAVDHGWAAVRTMLSELTRWRIGWRLYVIALGIAVALPGVPLALGLVTGAVGLTDIDLGSILPFVLPLFALQVGTSGLGEEPGWRGYLLPRLVDMPVERRVWVLGLIWAVWHYPFTAYYTLQGMGDVGFGASIMMVMLALAGQTMSLIAITYIYVWLLDRTHSLLLCVLFHAATNVASAVLAASTGSPSLIVLSAAMPWVVVLALQRIVGKARFPLRQR